MRRLSLLPLVLGSALLLAGAEASARATVAIPLAPAFTSAQLSAYAGNDWISNGGDLADDRYSSLTQITPSNVGKLKLAWHMNLGVCPVDPATGTKDQTCGSQEENAVVYQGIMYIATATGNVLWHYVPTFDPGFSIGTGGRQPGVSIGQGLVFLGQRDGKVVALNQGDGSIAWVASEGPWQKGIRLAETPMYFNGEVIEGNTGADGGSYSNSMQAFNATTGELMWNWNVVPSHNQPFGNTWPWSGVHSNYGGGAMWENPSIDPKLHSVIFGTGNPVPWNSRGPGADYWTDSIVSLDANTGYLNWAYQTVHHDLWDSDLPEGSVQFDMTVGGKTVHAVADVAKFGWTWILNAATGQPLEPVKNVAVPQDSAADVNTAPVQPIPQSPNALTGGYAGVGYDLALKSGSGRLCANATRWTGLTAPDGKPYLISCHFQPYDTSQFVVAPFESMDWPAASFDPLTNGYITCGVTNRSYGKEQVPAASQIVGSAGGVGSGILSVADSSIDPLNLNDFGNFSSLNVGSVNPTHGGAWQWHQIWQAPCYSGTVNTASGLTFVGHLGLGNAQNGLGYLAAVDSKTGTELWESPLMDAPAAAPPITYSVNGVQYVSVISGGESHNDPTRPNPSNPSQRVRGDSVYTYILGS